VTGRGAVRFRPKNGFNPAAGRAGFTLIEILLVIALLALIAFLFIGGTGDLFRAQEKTADDIFWQAVQAARLRAVQDDMTVDLRYDEKLRQLQWSANGTSAVLDWPGKSVEFFPLNQHDTVLLGGQLLDAGHISVVHFYPDGATDRFRVQLTDNSGRVTRLEIDQWTCAPVVSKEH
jgi:prepilin-type N-terminal cleavage/methylation domain-containing protein